MPPHTKTGAELTWTVVEPDGSALTDAAIAALAEWLVALAERDCAFEPEPETPEDC
jgi:hypothetical protein